MKITTVTKYQAQDGQQFDSIQECAEHEAKEALQRIPEADKDEAGWAYVWENIDAIVAIYQTYEKALASIKKPKKPSTRRPHPPQVPDPNLPTDAV